MYVNTHTQAGKIVRKLKKMNSKYYYIDESVYKSNQFFRAVLQLKKERKYRLYPIHIKNNIVQVIQNKVTLFGIIKKTKYTS